MLHCLLVEDEPLAALVLEDYNGSALVTKSQLGGMETLLAGRPFSPATPLLSGGPAPRDGLHGHGNFCRRAMHSHRQAI